MLRPKLLTLALLQVLCAPVSLAAGAADAADPLEAKQRELDAVVVTASPLQTDSESTLAPVAVLSGAELDDVRAQSLGETVARLPGVQTSFFGPAVGRPIVRGLEGSRVAVLEGGLSSMDASTVSADHAVSIEPFLADQIEVLKGPATLLYGSGAIGGVVNVVDGRVPQSVPEALSGRAEFSLDTVANTRQGAARIDAGSGMLALHADAFGRESDDYEIDGPAMISQPEDRSGRVANSRLENSGGALGMSLVGDSGFIGLAVSGYRTEYGIPGSAEAEETKSTGFEGVSIDLEQTRVDLDSAWEQPFNGAERLRFKLAHNDYQHQEIEPDGAIGTDFDNQEIESRLELVHRPWGFFEGAIGLTFGDRDFAAVGEEAFVPPSRSRNLGVFLIEQARVDDWNVEFGLRHERSRIDPDGDDASRFNLTSLSAAVRRNLNEQWQLGLLLDRAQRAPAAEELYANGPHIATGLFELGNAGLERESANQVELELRFEGERTHLHASVYYNRFDDYIFLVPLDFSEDGLPAAQWQQQDATFRGFELGAEFNLPSSDLGEFSLDLLADKVRARTDDPIACRCLPSTELPRIAPARFSMGLNWNHDVWRARLGAVHSFEPDNDFEADSPDNSYTLVHALLARSIKLGDTDSEIYLRGENLGDQLARSQVSFLKEVAPLPGRNFIVGMRVRF